MHKNIYATKSLFYFMHHVRYLFPVGNVGLKG